MVINVGLLPSGIIEPITLYSCLGEWNKEDCDYDLASRTIFYEIRDGCLNSIIDSYS